MVLLLHIIFKSYFELPKKNAETFGYGSVPLLKMKSSSPNCSLIITTYNWPEALQKVLQSVTWQSILPGEVLIADDGSTPDTSDIIKIVQTTFPIPIKHFWQEDKKKKNTYQQYRHFQFNVRVPDIY